MRLFIAIPIPDEVKQHLASLKIDAKVVKDYHLTLKFLGDVAETKLQELKSALSSIEFSHFRFKLTEIGFFPNARRVRIVWVGVKPWEPIKSLQCKIESKLSDIGFSRDNKFHPHITLARVKFLKDPLAFINQIENLQIAPVEIDVTQFELIKSTLTQQGPDYEAIATFINKA